MGHLSAATIVAASNWRAHQLADGNSSIAQRTRTARNWAALLASATRIVKVEFGGEKPGTPRFCVLSSIKMAPSRTVIKGRQVAKERSNLGGFVVDREIMALF
jgi:hypothetical protein